MRYRRCVAPRRRACERPDRTYDTLQRGTRPGGLYRVRRRVERRPGGPAAGNCDRRTHPRRTDTQQGSFSQDADSPGAPCPGYTRDTRTRYGCSYLRRHPSHRPGHDSIQPPDGAQSPEDSSSRRHVGRRTGIQHPDTIPSLAGRARPLGRRASTPQRRLQRDRRQCVSPQAVESCATRQGSMS